MQDVGLLVTIILDFAVRAKHNPAQLVTYFSEYGSHILTMEVSRALDIGRARLIAVWGDKVGQYIRVADERLASHPPTEAVVALKNWKSLPGLYDSRLGMVWPKNLENRIAEVEKRIKPELEAYEKADEHLKAVYTQIQVDVVRAYQSWREAREAYPYHPDLEPRQSRLLEKARAEVQSLIAEFEPALRKEEWHHMRAYSHSPGQSAGAGRVAGTAPAGSLPSAARDIPESEGHSGESQDARATGASERVGRGVSRLLATLARVTKAPRQADRAP